MNVTESGIYTVVATNVQTGCKETVDVTVEIEPEVIEPEEPATSTVAIYPNPATDILNVNIQEDAALISMIVVIDAFGQQVKLIPFDGSETQEINVSNLNTGIYTIGFQKSTGEIIDMKKVVIAK